MTSLSSQNNSLANDRDLLLDIHQWTARPRLIEREPGAQVMEYGTWNREKFKIAVVDKLLRCGNHHTPHSV
jgi:hypothetical protein